MAQMITVLGAVLGFIAAIIGFFLFDISFLSAFALWALSGPAAAMMGFVFAGTKRPHYTVGRHSTYDAAA